jgi:hypothetical protein
VPAELFNEPFDALLPAARGNNLGRRYQVVLRHLDRMQDPEQYTPWLRRWQRMQRSHHPLSPQWFACPGVPSSEKFAAELELDPALTVVALSQRPDAGPIQDLLLAALDAGVPVALWRRAACADHDGSDVAGPCIGARFQAVLTELITRGRALALPEAIRLLRNQVSLDRDHAGRDVVLLWDDPTALVELDTPLTTPAQRLAEPAEDR